VAHRTKEPHDASSDQEQEILGKKGVSLLWSGAVVGYVVSANRWADPQPVPPWEWRKKEVAVESSKTSIFCCTLLTLPMS